MRINRNKKASKYLNFYCNNYGFHKPFQVLIDGTFCFSALKNKVNIKDQIPKYLGGDVKLLTTQCVILETEKLGTTVFGAMMIVKQFAVHRCGHEKKPVLGSECLTSMLGERNTSREVLVNSTYKEISLQKKSVRAVLKPKPREMCREAFRYIIATQDRELQNIVRGIPGTPLLYLHIKTPTMEEPSRATLKDANNKINERFGVRTQDSVIISSLKEATFGPQEDSKPKRRKHKGGPNPLSCKKKKKKPQINQQNKTEEGKRKRKRLKLPKHIKEVLNKNG